MITMAVVNVIIIRIGSFSNFTGNLNEDKSVPFPSPKLALGKHILLAMLGRSSQQKGYLYKTNIIGGI